MEWNGMICVLQFNATENTEIPYAHILKLVSLCLWAECTKLPQTFNATRLLL